MKLCYVLLGKGIPLHNQFFFQDSFTQFATLIVNVHHIIWYFATGIAIFVSWLLFIIVWEFKLENYGKISFDHHKPTELKFTNISNIQKSSNFFLSLFKSVERILMGSIFFINAKLIDLGIKSEVNIKFFNGNVFLKIVNEIVIQVRFLFTFIYDLKIWKHSNPKKENYTKGAIETAMKFNHGDTIEFLWLLAPCIILVLIAIPSFCILLSLKVEYDAMSQVKIIGNQWYWTYQVCDWHYKEVLGTWVDVVLANKGNTGSFDWVATENTYDSYMLSTDDLKLGEYRLLDVDYPLEIKARKMYRCLITSNDVLHSWAVPSLGIKTDAVPGRLNQLFLYVLATGTYYGQCSELCGVNHGFMPIVVKVS